MTNLAVLYQPHSLSLQPVEHHVHNLQWRRGQSITGKGVVAVGVAQHRAGQRCAVAGLGCLGCRSVRGCSLSVFKLQDKMQVQVQDAGAPHDR